MLGAGGLFQPDYEGSDDYEVTPLPLLMVNYRDLVFLRGPMLGANVLTLQGPRPGDGRCQLGQDAGIQTPRSPSIDAVRLAP